jgi:hypothetical protein
MLVSGSYQGIVVVDDKDRYRGVIMPADLYSGLIESSSNRASIISLTRHRDTFLKPNMKCKGCHEHFDRAEAELFAVVSDEAHLTVVGYLTEAYARRRYAEELDQATQGIVYTLRGEAAVLSVTSHTPVLNPMWRLKLRRNASSVCGRSSNHPSSTSNPPWPTSGIPAYPRR